ncbi:MAG: hypothetical protein K0Q72_5170 [Armatimonadetes bacterium]|jgi:hypothetical protein|nr:hypothetical protein [Armatimonadota bacterium]
MSPELLPEGFDEAARAVLAEMRVGNCPDPEQIDAYAEHLLSGGEMRAVRRHLRECPACLHALLEGREEYADVVALHRRPWRSAGLLLDGQLPDEESEFRYRLHLERCVRCRDIAGLRSWVRGLRGMDGGRLPDRFEPVSVAAVLRARRLGYCSTAAAGLLAVAVITLVVAPQGQGTSYTRKSVPGNTGPGGESQSGVRALAGLIRDDATLEELQAACKAYSDWEQDPRLAQNPWFLQRLAVVFERRASLESDPALKSYYRRLAEGIRKMGVMKP